MKSRVIYSKVTNSFLRAGWVLAFNCLVFNGPVVFANDNQRVYSFGVVPQFTAQETRKIWVPILSEIEKESGLRIELSSSSTIPAFETQVMVGEFDFAYMNPYIAYKAGEIRLYTPLLKDINQPLHGIVVVKKDSDIQYITELDNKLVAFPAPNALGASLIIKAALSDDYNVKVLPKYVQSHSSVYLNVALGRVVAGGGVQKTLQKQDANIINKLKVIYRSKNFSPHPIAAHKRVPENHQILLKEAFLAFSRTKKGKKLLTKIPITEIGPASFEDYKVMKSWNLDRFYVQE